jgi:hypothetical protein
MLQRVIHLTFLADDKVKEAGILDVAVGGHERGVPIVLVYFPVAEQVGTLHQLVHELDATLIVGAEVVAVGEVEGIDVVTVGREA